MFCRYLCRQGFAGRVGCAILDITTLVLGNRESCACHSCAIYLIYQWFVNGRRAIKNRIATRAGTVKGEINMAGHSKWKNIVRKKGANDQARAKIFTKAGREIAVAVREGGADPASNSRLRDVIAKAKANNVPNENIDRIIKKAAGEAGGAAFETITYEGYGPSGIAVIVETMTDNRNRTAGEMRHYFDKSGGNLGQTGAVNWQFDAKGQIIIERADKDENTVLMDALDAGAADFDSSDEVFEIICEPADLTAVRESLEAKGYEFLQAEIAMIPQTTVELTSEDDIKMMRRLLNMLDENDDVQSVWHNWENEDAGSEEE